MKDLVDPGEAWLLVDDRNRADGDRDVGDRECAARSLPRHDDLREAARDAVLRRVLRERCARTHPAVRKDAGLRVAEARRRLDAPELHPVARLADLLADDLDAIPRHDPADTGVGTHCSVWRAEVRRERRQRRGAVEAPDLVDRVVPELEQPDRVRVLAELLAEEERRLAAGGPVDPVDRLRRDLVHPLGEDVQAAGGVDLGRQRPRRHAAGGDDGDREPDCARADERQRAARSATETSAVATSARSTSVGIPDEVAVREVADREARSLEVRVLVEPQLCVQDEEQRHERSRRRAPTGLASGRESTAAVAANTIGTR